MKKERLALGLEIKEADEGSRTFSAALSSSHMDLGGWTPDGFRRDIVQPGAFKRWANAFTKSKDPYVPLLDSHQMHGSVFNAYGTLQSAQERLTGKTHKYTRADGSTLEVAEMFLDTEWKVLDGADGERMMDRLRSGVVRKMSMGYNAMKSDTEELVVDKQPAPARLLKEVRVLEGSLVIVPMNPKADVDLSTVKFLQDLEEAGQLTDEDRDELLAMKARIQALLDGPALATDAPERAALDARILSMTVRRLATR